MANEELKRDLRKAGITLWQVADMLEVSESTMTRKMRHELPKEEYEKIIAMIKTKED